MVTDSKVARDLHGIETGARWGPPHIMGAWRVHVVDFSLMILLY